MLDPREIEAKRPDQCEYGPIAKEPKFTLSVNLFAVFRWFKNKKENVKHDYNK